MNKNNTVVIVVVAILAIAAIAFLMNSRGAAPVVGDLGEFAQCLKDSGAKFYGAFWCSHCQNQKAAFGAAADKLPYVECSTPDGQGTQSVCTQAGISGYPTWVFADGSRASGEQSLQTLADKTGCTLPSQ